ncbi:serine protease [Kibdelosporangium philippinense]|uniref:Serine protease n=1 Tax=Kibdelosporangium philippinense TaxID=211113 RepID=A0ABS8ZR47_9PSEU|nr:serine protease [Kibdelosporangium philippinense]MCE7010216.1 serine protease [Kibdelosporangium philippinense]
MSNTGENASGPQRDESEPWRACLRDTDTGEILGAGVVLSDRVVLTCAHVIPDARSPVHVELVGQQQLITAIVLPDCWAPPQHDERADLALLRLDRPVWLRSRPRLRNLRCPRGRAVHAYGFPAPLDYGVFASAELSGTAGPGGEWVQIDSQAHRELLRKGFSGAGVVDEETGAVVGIVTMAYHDDVSHLAWMIPVEVVAKYLPKIRSFIGKEIPCGQRTAGGDLLIEFSPNGIAEIKMKVDLTKKSPDEAYRDLRHLPPPVDKPRGSEPVGVTGIEQSQDPKETFTAAVAPFVRDGNTVVLHLSDADSPVAQLVRQTQREALLARIEALTEGVTDLAQREDLARTHRRRARSRLLPPPEITELPALSAEFQLPVAALRGSVEEKDPDRVRRAVERYERKLDRSRDLVDQVDKEADAAMLVHERLRGLLASYNARAVQHGLVEDKELDALLLAARTALEAHPCELRTAEARVDVYVGAVRRRLGGERA